MSEATRLYLPEHLDNPFVLGLGPPHDVKAQMSILTRAPSFSEAERSYPAHLRRYYALRLFEFVHARTCQMTLMERIGMLIRSGYKHRNPTLGEHHACILDAAERRETGHLHMVSSRVRTAATGMALLGQPGMGKSLTVEVTLEAFPKVLRPILPYAVVQVPWLKVECPSKGGQRQFCIAFFKALGDRVGEDYSSLFGRAGKGGDNMLLDVQQLCQVHALGILVIDELQHILHTNEGPEPLMNFLVTLVNVIGVPVLLVGTMGATSIIEQDFRSARRAAGLGQPTWARLRPGPEWDDLVKEMWRYQWTAQASPLTEEVKEAVYHETQGIIDIVVKLFVLCQFRAISLGETRPGTREEITPALVAKVAEDEFRVIRPMMRALREGREDQLDAYPDLKEFHHHVSATISRGTLMTMSELRDLREASQRSAQAEASAPDDPINPIRALLSAKGMAEDVVEAVLADALRREPSRDPFKVVNAVQEILEGRSRTNRKKPHAKGSKSTATDEGADPSSTAGDPDAGDLRSLAFDARRRGTTVHAAFVANGTSRPVPEIVAA